MTPSVDEKLDRIIALMNDLFGDTSLDPADQLKAFEQIESMAMSNCESLEDLIEKH